MGLVEIPIVYVFLSSVDNIYAVVVAIYQLINVYLITSLSIDVSLSFPEDFLSLKKKVHPSEEWGVEYVGIWNGNCDLSTTGSRGLLLRSHIASNFALEIELMTESN